ncbi:outer membrane protein assembly factor BamE [Marinomonas ostreistagni]|uniref:outer membrane protein assembly factor BamE n=1 Tax=Marinomonas ostreistagni TaxID=359209 RepID=UPI00194E1AEA|nr:outer membrane protein assembly factor BamE [Marinomonas ostreistagni]MBM6552190.1 outer membrane protein assembly factor BamE [Marinomonas ostreistagni]
MKKTILLLTTLITLSGCSLLPEPYKPPVVQGNVIKTEQVQQLQLGMTESQVMYVLGTPMVQNTVQPNLWHYLFTSRYTNKDSIVSEVKHLTLTFDNGRLQNIQQR